MAVVCGMEERLKREMSFVPYGRAGSTCDSYTLAREQTSTVTDCASKCFQNDICRYFSFYYSGRCDLSITCDQTRSPKEPIVACFQMTRRHGPQLSSAVVPDGHWSRPAVADRTSRTIVVGAIELHPGLINSLKRSWARLPYSFDWHVYIQHAEYCRAESANCGHKHWHWFGDLWNGTTVDELDAFFEKYRTDALTLSIDIFFCAAPPRLCELWVPFNRTIISLGGMDLGALPRIGDTFSVKWKHTYTAMCLQPQNLCATTNAYYAAQYEYWTDIRPAVFRVFADFWTPDESERWRRGSRALVEGRSVICFGAEALLRANERARASGVGPTLEWDDPGAAKATRRADPASFWVSFGAIVLCPYTFASIHFSELHTLAIPLFVPSVEYLSFMSDTDKRLDQNYCAGYIRSNKKLLGPPPLVPYFPTEQTNVGHRAAERFWIQLADMYQYPHVQTFASLDDLVDRLAAADLPSISRSMREANRVASELTTERWRHWFELRLGSNEPFGSERYTPPSYRAAMDPFGEPYERLGGYNPFVEVSLDSSAKVPLIDDDEDPVQVAMLTHAGDEAYITVVVRSNLHGVANSSLYIEAMGDESSMQQTRFGSCDECFPWMAQFRARRRVGSAAPLHLRLFVVTGGGERVISLFNVQWGANELATRKRTYAGVPPSRGNETQLLILYSVSRASHFANFAIDSESDVNTFLDINIDVPVINDGGEWSLTPTTAAIMLYKHVRVSLSSLHDAELPPSVSPFLQMLFGIEGPEGLLQFRLVEDDSSAPGLPGGVSILAHAVPSHTRPFWQFKVKWGNGDATWEPWAAVRQHPDLGAYLKRARLEASGLS